MIEDFKARQSIDQNVDPEAFKRLTSKEKEYANKYVRFVFRGKLNRTVEVILPKDLENCCVAIIRHRKEANVPDNKGYLFGLPSNDGTRLKYVRACGLLRKYSENCDTDMP